jgi:hypothetical protein
MKKILLIALALLTFGSQMEVNAQKLKWNWDGKTLSGNAKIDNYIKTIDTLYNKVQSYIETMDKYQMYTQAFEDKKTGKKYEMVYMLDEEGKLVSRNTVNWQCVQAIMQGTSIVLDMTNAGLLSADAALTLPDLGLKALKFGKYVKGGPAVISEGTKAIKEVRKRWINNSRTWKDMKVDAIEDPKSINYDGMSDALAQTLNKCVYIKEVKEFSETKLEGKSESAQIKDMGTALSDIAKLEQAKEDARKSNENLDEGFDDLLKDAEKDA